MSVAALRCCAARQHAFDSSSVRVACFRVLPIESVVPLLLISLSCDHFCVLGGAGVGAHCVCVLAARPASRQTCDPTGCDQLGLHANYVGYTTCTYVLLRWWWRW